MTLPQNKYFYLGIIVFLVAISHQLSRFIIFPIVAERGVVEVTSFFNLVEVRNSGISFGLMNGLAYGHWILSSIAIGITMIMLYILHNTKNKISVVALSLIIGGAVGNTIDRVVFRAVADYLDFHAFGYHWPAFNVTDAAIFLGVGIILLKETGFFHRK